MHTSILFTLKCPYQFAQTPKMVMAVYYDRIVSGFFVFLMQVMPMKTSSSSRQGRQRRGWASVHERWAGNVALARAGGRA
jgi:hypothetical protein